MRRATTKVTRSYLYAKTKKAARASARQVNARPDTGHPRKHRAGVIDHTAEEAIGLEVPESRPGLIPGLLVTLVCDSHTKTR